MAGAGGIWERVSVVIEDDGGALAAAEGGAGRWERVREENDAGGLFWYTAVGWFFPSAPPAAVSNVLQPARFGAGAEAAAAVAAGAHTPSLMLLLPPAKGTAPALLCCTSSCCCCRFGFWGLVDAPAVVWAQGGARAMMAAKSGRFLMQLFQWFLMALSLLRGGIHAQQQMCSGAEDGV